MTLFWPLRLGQNKLDCQLAVPCPCRSAGNLSVDIGRCPKPFCEATLDLKLRQVQMKPFPSRVRLRTGEECFSLVLPLLIRLSCPILHRGLVCACCTATYPMEEIDALCLMCLVERLEILLVTFEGVCHLRCWRLGLVPLLRRWPLLE